MKLISLSNIGRQINRFGRSISVLSHLTGAHGMHLNNSLADYVIAEGDVRTFIFAEPCADRSEFAPTEGEVESRGGRSPCRRPSRNFLASGSILISLHPKRVND
jgi:hypothetical protein